MDGYRQALTSAYTYCHALRATPNFATLPRICDLLLIPKWCIIRKELQEGLVSLGETSTTTVGLYDLSCQHFTGSLNPGV